MSVKVSDIKLVPFHDAVQDGLQVSACIECPFGIKGMEGSSDTGVTCTRVKGYNPTPTDTILENCPLRNASIVVYLGLPETPKKVRP